MRELGNMAVIGSGATAVFLLHGIAKNAEMLSCVLRSVTIFEKTAIPGCGMPYHPETTDIYNMSNISSEEIPELPETYLNWLRKQNPAQLRQWRIDPNTLCESEVYPRLPLGAYLQAQYQAIVSQIREAGITVEEKTCHTVTDIIPDEAGKTLRITLVGQPSIVFDSAVIATGHTWSNEDDPDNGYYASPWPISKIIPAEGTFLNFHIGTLGASLSAFDVVSSLSHRHGEFRKNGTGLTYHPFPGTDGFRITMHSAKGWLPNLQFEQDEPFRAIYRHVTRQEMLELRDCAGRLRIADYFDRVCRPALLEAFSKDGLDSVVEKLRVPSFSLPDFVALMSERHEYPDAFVGMQKEMLKARDSVENHKPIHWKEVIDDLMYTLNFHAELMPAEDYLLFMKTVMPFLMNVIAAIPLSSAEMLFALREAGKLDLISGHVSLPENSRSDGLTTICIENDHATEESTYRMFIDCSGQGTLGAEQYPFQTLVKKGRIRPARAEFISEESYRKLEREDKSEHLFRDGQKFLLHTGGVDIDSAYRVIAADGTPDSSIFDLAFPHASGVRPYSYGLQACNATAEIVYRSWLEAIDQDARIKGSLEETADLYTEI